MTERIPAHVLAEIFQAAATACRQLEPETELVPCASARDLLATVVIFHPENQVMRFVLGLVTEYFK